MAPLAPAHPAAGLRGGRCETVEDSTPPESSPRALNLLICWFLQSCAYRRGPVTRRLRKRTSFRCSSEWTAAAEGVWTAASLAYVSRAMPAFGFSPLKTAETAHCGSSACSFGAGLPRVTACWGRQLHAADNVSHTAMHPSTPAWACICATKRGRKAGTPKGQPRPRRARLFWSQARRRSFRFTAGLPGFNGFLMIRYASRTEESASGRCAGIGRLDGFLALRAGVASRSDTVDEMVVERRILGQTIQRRWIQLGKGEIIKAHSQN
jgi:hypothetical protein